MPIPATLKKTAEQTPKWAATAKVSEESLARIMPEYYGMVKCIDDSLGRILDTLRECGLMENTIVVFTADHGDLCGEHGRLNKGVPYEGSARIPFVIYYPEQIAAGTVVDEALSCVDFLPTVLSLMDVKTPGREQGRDASALFVGKDSAEWDDVAFLRGTSGAGWLCVVTDQYKLVYAPQGDPWLFDLKKDPDELTNFFHDPDYHYLVRQLTAQLAEYCEQYDDPYGDVPQIRADMAAVLKSRG